jgi:hypothetical protein
MLPWSGFCGAQAPPEDARLRMRPWHGAADSQCVNIPLVWTAAQLAVFLQLHRSNNEKSGSSAAMQNEEDREPRLELFVPSAAGGGAGSTGAVMETPRAPPPPPPPPKRKHDGSGESGRSGAAADAGGAKAVNASASGGAAAAADGAAAASTGQQAAPVVQQAQPSLPHTPAAVHTEEHAGAPAPAFARSRRSKAAHRPSTSASSAPSAAPLALALALAPPAQAHHTAAAAPADAAGGRHTALDGYTTHAQHASAAAMGAAGAGAAASQVPQVQASAAAPAAAAAAAAAAPADQLRGFFTIERAGKLRNTRFQAAGELERALKPNDVVRLHGTVRGSLRIIIYHMCIPHTRKRVTLRGATTTADALGAATLAAPPAPPPPKSPDEEWDGAPTLCVSADGVHVQDLRIEGPPCVEGEPCVVEVGWRGRANGFSMRNCVIQGADNEPRTVGGACALPFLRVCMPQACVRVTASCADNMMCVVLPCARAPLHGLPVCPLLQMAMMRCNWATMAYGSRTMRPTRRSQT